MNLLANEHTFHNQIYGESSGVRIHLSKTQIHLFRTRLTERNDDFRQQIVVSFLFPFRFSLFSPIVVSREKRRGNREKKIWLCSAKHSLSKNPCFQEAKAWVFFGRWGNKEKNQARMEFSQLQFASFFRFMAANLSLTHRVTAAKPLWCV